MKQFLKKLLPSPAIGLFQSWRYQLTINKRRFKGKNVREIFSEIHRQRYWVGGQSVSGPGSDLGQTEVVRRELPRLLEKYQIRSLLDIPCGDFNWMQHVDLQGVRYIGADIVPDIVEANRAKFSRENRQFQVSDLIVDPLPKADLALVRDCLVHLSYEHIRASLANLQRCGVRYLLTTSFSGERKNTDVHTGGWRVLNLQKAPFHFPEPLEIIVEECTESSGAYADKCLMLWELRQIILPTT